MKGRIVGWTLASFWLLVLVASPVAVARAHVSRSKRLPLAPGTRYLALGDSVTFGYEEGGVTPKPNYHDAASFIGYPEQIAREIHVKVANAACPGETSSSLIDPKAQSYACENF